MNMETLSKLTAPAAAKIRQLQKIVQDIKKNDDSFLNKLRRLRNKPSPKTPDRDYGDNGDFDGQLSDPEYGNDVYEDLPDDQDGKYEPPPSHRAFTSTASSSYPKGEYIDSCRHRPKRPPRKPLHLSRDPQPHSCRGIDEDDYISPDSSIDDDNYVEPEENHPSNPIIPCGPRTAMERPMLSSSTEQHCDVYEVPDAEESSPPTGRQCWNSAAQLHPLPPKPSPRAAMRALPPEPTSNDEYEVCDPDDGPRDTSGQAPPPTPPKPMARERSPKPPPRPELKPRRFESQTLPLLQTPPKPSPGALTMDFKQPNRPPIQHMSLPKPPLRGSVPTENGSTDDADADMRKKPWYSGACDRKTADDIIFRTNIDGAFMVRKSSGNDAQQPYTLVVLYRDRVYNIPIRFMENTQQYALGREKRGQEYFSSVSSIVESHQRIPLVLIDGQSNNKDATRLCYPVKP